jgi:hypothetical protein
MQIIVAIANAMPKEGERGLSWYLVVSKWFIFQTNADVFSWI